MAPHELFWPFPFRNSLHKIISFLLSNSFYFHVWIEDDFSAATGVTAYLSRARLPRIDHEEASSRLKRAITLNTLLSYLVWSGLQNIGLALFFCRFMDQTKLDQYCSYKDLRLPR